MKLFYTGDWQAQLSNLDECEIVVQQILDWAKDNRKQKRHVFHLGDVKEKFNPIDVRVANFIVDAFRRIAEAVDGLHFVRGNHDPITTQDGVPSCVPLIERYCMTLADQSVGHVDLSPVHVWMVPFFRGPDTQLEAFASALEDRLRFPRGTKHVLAFHNTITGCKQSAHSTGTGLSLEDIAADKYDVCVGGHVHLAQKIPPNVWYVGSPFSCDWGEANYSHGFLEIEF